MQKVPSLALGEMEEKKNSNKAASKRGLGKVIQIEDVEHEHLNSSENRDEVPSLRDNKVPLAKLDPPSGPLQSRFSKTNDQNEGDSKLNDNKLDSKRVS